MPFGDPDVDAFSSSLVSVWPLDESSGTRVDSVGSNDLTDVNTVGSGTGKDGNAADFIAANSECLSFGSGITDTSGDFAASFWFNADDTTPAIVFSQHNLTFGEALTFQWNPDGLTVFVTDTANRTILQGGLSTGTFHHAIAIADGSTLYMFVNGTQSGTVAIGTLKAGDNFRVGCRNTGADNLFFNGLVDEISLWNGLSFGGGNPTRQEFVDGLFNGGAGLFFFPPTTRMDTIRRISRPVNRFPVHHSLLE